MIVSREYFKIELKRIGDLTGQRVLATVSDLLYKELGDINTQDFTHAMHMFKYSDKRITLGNLDKVISYAMSIRLEKELLQQQKNEQAQAEQFWKQDEAYVKAGKCDYKCLSCKVNYCDVIHKHSIRAMKSLLDKTKTLTQVNAEMTLKFEGWLVGFDAEPF